MNIDLMNSYPIYIGSDEYDLKCSHISSKLGPSKSIIK